MGLRCESDYCLLDNTDQNLYENHFKFFWAFLENLWFKFQVLDPYKSWQDDWQNSITLSAYWKCSINVSRADDRCLITHSWLYIAINVSDIHCNQALLTMITTQYRQITSNQNHVNWSRIDAVKLRCLWLVVMGPIVVKLRKRVFKWQFHKHPIQKILSRLVY